MNKKSGFLKGILPAVIWLVISAILLMLPGSAFPAITWLTKVHFDKIVHVVMFTILVWLFCRAIFYNNIVNPKSLLLFLFVFLLSVFYGLLMEYLQGTFAAYRSFDWGDVVADIIGGTAGYLISLKLYTKNRPL